MVQPMRKASPADKRYLFIRIYTFIFFTLSAICYSLTRIIEILKHIDSFNKIDLAFFV